MSDLRQKSDRSDPDTCHLAIDHDDVLVLIETLERTGDVSYLLSRPSGYGAVLDLLMRLREAMADRHGDNWRGRLVARDRMREIRNSEPVEAR